MKKAIYTVSILLFLSLGLFLILSDGTATLAEICGIEKGTVVTQVRIDSAGKGDNFSEGGASYTEGDIYNKYVALFFEERFSGEGSGDPFLTKGLLYQSAKISFHFEGQATVALIVPPYYEETPEYAILITQTDYPRKEYIIYLKGRTSFDELERLARSDEK